MRRTLPIRAEFSEQPQLAVLDILDETLEQSTRTLSAVHPAHCEEVATRRSEDSEEAAYAMALIFQIHALEGTLQCYRESLQRARKRALEEDWPSELDNADARIA